MNYLAVGMYKLPEKAHSKLSLAFSVECHIAFRRLCQAKQEYIVADVLKKKKKIHNISQTKMTLLSNYKTMKSQVKK